MTFEANGTVSDKTVKTSVKMLTTARPGLFL